MENMFHDLISAMNRQQGQTSVPSTNSPFQAPSVPAPLPVEEDDDDDDDDDATRPTGAGSDSDERTTRSPVFDCPVFVSWPPVCFGMRLIGRIPCAR